ncbi:cystine ABC transporter permease [Escherichia coli]|nr:cystine ABC transporter permease [Escherichia coli]
MQESIQLVIDSLPFLLKGAGYTLQLSIGGMFFGLLLGFILALMRLSPIWPVRWLARFYISIFRGTPLIAQLFMIYYGLPQFGIELDPIPSAMIGLSLNTAAYTAETLRAAISSIDKGQWEAAASIGMTPWQTMRRAILPQAARVALPPLSNSFISLVNSCVVFDANGPLRAEYRRYNITGITPGDDYAAMNQVLRRRYGKAIDDSKIPDVILIDGGKGQLAQAKNVFAELDVSWDKNHPLLLGVAKGADRKAGLETLFFEPEGEGFSLPPDSPALHVIQHIRDESHDHAIGGHRKKRAKVKNTSSLETIEGVGPKRRQMLLKYMGGLQGLRNASVEEIAKVPGISQGLAEKIFWSLKH